MNLLLENLPEQRVPNHWAGSLGLQELCVILAMTEVFGLSWWCKHYFTASSMHVSQEWGFVLANWNCAYLWMCGWAWAAHMQRCQRYVTGKWQKLCRIDQPYRNVMSFNCGYGYDDKYGTSYSSCICQNDICIHLHLSAKSP